MNETPIWMLGAAGIAERLAAGSVEAAEVLDVFLDRHDRLNGTLNTIAFLDRDGARRAADEATKRQREGRRLGPLDGVPITVKDNLYVKGLPAEWGSRLFAGHRPEHDDLCVERLRAAGAVIVGKSATAEFALSGRTNTDVLGVTRNPWNPAMTPGGSSGGAVAGVAAGLVPLAIGTDAGGSIRLPASYTGLVGMRPSNGRVARRYGFPPMAIDFQAIGLVARTTADLSLLFEALAGPDPRDPVSASIPPSAVPDRPLRIGWFDVLAGDGPDPEVRASLDDALKVLAALGHEIVPVAPPFDIAVVRSVFDTLASVGAARVALRFPDWEAKVTASLAGIVRRGCEITARDYVDALDALYGLRADTSAAWGDYDLLVSPTGAGPAFPTELECPSTIAGRPGTGAVQHMYCGWVNAVGFAGLSVPGIPHPDGRPIGVQFVARAGGDELLIALARAFEAAAPSADRWPAMAIES